MAEHVDHTASKEALQHAEEPVKVPYVLHIDVSAQLEVDKSSSRRLGATFMSKFKEIHPQMEVQHLDLAVHSIPHIDIETIDAQYTPVESRSPSQLKKFDERMALVKQIQGAAIIFVASPMYNWNVPSALKAYIDWIVMAGVNDSQTKSLAHAKVTVALACGGSYSPGSWHPEYDFETGYLKHIFSVLGATDIDIIRTEFTLAGVVPGMETLVTQKDESLAAAETALIARAASM